MMAAYSKVTNKLLNAKDTRNSENSRSDTGRSCTCTKLRLPELTATSITATN